MGTFNIGAVKYLWLMATDEISVHFTGNNFSSCSLAISPDLESCLIDATNQTILPEVVFDDDDNSGIWSIKLSGTIPHSDATARAIANKALRPCVAVVENMNGDMFLLGHPNSPLTPAKLERNNPEKIANSTGYNFSLAGFSTFEPAIVSSIA